MTLPMPSSRGIPEATATLARKVFPNGNVYLRLRDELGTLYEDELFADLFKPSGGYATAPGRVALVQVMAFMENLSDRQAALAVGARIDWKYALGLELDDPGFDYSVLSEFRQRVLAGQADQRLLEHLLDVLQARGVLKARGRQRTDSTHVLSAARELSRLEMVGETLRRALDAVAVAAPDWLQAWVPAEWVDRYAQPLDEYRLPKGRAEREALAATIGLHGCMLLERVYAEPWGVVALASYVRFVPAVEALRRIWLQQYQVRNGVVRWRAADDLPPGARLIRSPVDLDARHSVKRDTTWTGYKVCLTETCDPETPHLIVHVETPPATTPDDGLLAPIHADLAAHGRLPSEHAVDCGFATLASLTDSAATYQVEVLGPLRDDTSWQARAGQGFSQAAFALDWEAQQATCPQGQPSRRWSTATDEAGPIIRVAFDPATCAACPCRPQCTHSATKPRRLRLRPQALHQAQEAQRQYQDTPEFWLRQAIRAGIEGTLSEVSARSGLRQARYLGQAKVHLQHLVSAAATNLVRVAHWLAGLPRAKTRTSHFAQLFPAPALAL